jgi:hypothetical protein
MTAMARLNERYGFKAPVFVGIDIDLYAAGRSLFLEVNDVAVGEVAGDISAGERTSLDARGGNGRVLAAVKPNPSSSIISKPLVKSWAPSRTTATALSVTTRTASSRAWRSARLRLPDTLSALASVGA